MQRRSLIKIVCTAICATAGLSLIPSAQAAEPLKAAWVYVAPVGEVGWSFAHDEGRKAVEAEFGNKVKTTFIESVPEGPDAERVLRNLAMDGNTVIFTTSFGHMDPTLKAARAFPKVVFQHATGYKTGKNMGTYDVRTYEGAYLAGVVAGKMTKSNKLGFVASFPIPEVVRNIDAFTIGARSVNPKATTRVVWISSWYDPGKEREAALTLITQGADVLLQNTDSPAIVQAANEKGVYAFGWDSDMGKFGPKAHLAASSINWGVRYKEVIKGVLDGSLDKSKSVWYGVKENAIDLDHISAAMPADVKALVAERKQAIIDGKRPVFMGPLKDQAGKEIVAAGKEISEEDKHKINFYVEGVEGSLPTGK